jgi:hypothetical protein
MPWEMVLIVEPSGPALKKQMISRPPHNDEAAFLPRREHHQLIGTASNVPDAEVVVEGMLGMVLWFGN